MRSEFRFQTEITTVEIFHKYNEIPMLTVVIFCITLTFVFCLFPRPPVALCICCQILPPGPLPAHRRYHQVCKTFTTHTLFTLDGFYFTFLQRNSFYKHINHAPKVLHLFRFAKDKNIVTISLVYLQHCQSKPKSLSILRIKPGAQLTAVD